jgi:protein-tyrosine phosphatase
MTSASESFSIVIVCTANRFRSPLAAAVLSRELQPLPVEVVSRGTRDVGAMPPLTQALDSASRLGVDISRHRARRLKAEDLLDAGLVLGFESSHLEAARRGGAAPGVVYGLEEAVELLGRLDRRPGIRNYGSSLRHILAVAHLLRDPRAILSEIEDPVGKQPKDAAAIVRRVHSLSLRLARLLSP